MSAGDEPPRYIVRAGRAGSREFYERDGRPGDPPTWVLHRPAPKLRAETPAEVQARRARRSACPEERECQRAERAGRERKNGRPSALSTNDVLKIPIALTILRQRSAIPTHPETGYVNINLLAQKVAVLIFGKASDIRCNEHVRRLIRSHETWLHESTESLP